VSGSAMPQAKHPATTPNFTIWVVSHRACQSLRVTTQGTQIARGHGADAHPTWAAVTRPAETASPSEA